MSLGQPRILWLGAQQIVTLVPDLEAVGLDCLSRLPPRRGPDSVLRDRADGAHEVRRWVPADAPEMPGEQGVGALVDLGEPIDLGSMTVGEQPVVVGLALEKVNGVVESCKSGAVPLDGRLKDHSIGIGAPESFPQSSWAERRKLLLRSNEERCRVRALALESGELCARIGWSGSEQHAQRAPLSEQVTQIRLSPTGRVASEVDGELLSSRSAECVGDDLERVGLQVRAGVFGGLVSVSADDVEVVAEPAA